MPLADNLIRLRSSRIWRRAYVLQTLTRKFLFREVFIALADEERIGVIQGPLDEIVRMLEQNLLNKFKSRVALEKGAIVGGVVTTAWERLVLHLDLFVGGMKGVP